MKHKIEPGKGKTHDCMCHSMGWVLSKAWRFELKLDIEPASNSCEQRIHPTSWIQYLSWSSSSVFFCDVSYCKGW